MSSKEYSYIIFFDNISRKKFLVSNDDIIQTNGDCSRFIVIGDYRFSIIISS